MNMETQINVVGSGNSNDININPYSRTTKAGAVRLSTDFEYVLTQTGLSQDAIATIRSAIDPFDALAVALKKQVHKAREEYEEAVRKSGLTEQEYLNALKKFPTVDAAMQKADLSAGLGVGISAMADFVDTMIDMLKRQSTESFFPQKATVAPSDSEKSLGTASPDMVALVEERKKDPTQFVGMNLSGLNLSGLALAGLDFTDSICEATDFRNCDLQGACFKGATLTDAQMQGTQMMGTDLTGSIASGAIFDGADFTKANLSQANLIDCSLRSVHFDQAVLEQTQLDQSDMTGATFVAAQCKQMSACEALFDGCDFTEAQLDQTDFMKTTLKNCRFDRTTGQRTEFSGAMLTDVQFSGACLKDCTAMLKASFASCVFDQCELEGLNWTSAQLHHTAFNLCSLGASDFSSGDFKQVSFSKSKVKNVSFFSCTLEGVTFSQNNLMEASFHGAKLKACSLVGNNLFGANFIETGFDENTSLQGNVTLNTILVHRGYPTEK